MSTQRFLILWFITTLAGTSIFAETGKVGPSPSGLSVLYAGKPDSSRMQVFAGFLNQHFKKVETCDFEQLTSQNAADFDVVVFDWVSVYPRDAEGNIDHTKHEILSPRLHVDSAYRKPTVMIGAAAGTFCNTHPMTINWKCLCLENYAHDVDTEHPVFKGPLAVNMTFESIEKPNDYFLYPGTMKLGEKMEAWKIQGRSFPDVDPGLVSSRENFINTEDAEVISGGCNGKGPTSVAIGRHGNFMLWGFSGSPKDMTESARNAFINSLCYMTAFDGQSPRPFQANYDTPEHHLASIYFLRATSEPYVDQQVRSMQEMIDQNKVPQEVIDQIGNDPKAYLSNMMKLHTDKVLQRIPDAIRKQHQDNVEEIIQFYTEHAAQLRVNSEQQFVTDDRPSE
ncbi:hypothetical protein SH528x_001952 [Novipirellula sp. SH528]|uniref:hypothetical protein n=1 Tax=Novipirellula sp. SH528 TaxID=3454466 RepID=UPI003F9F971B